MSWCTTDHHPHPSIIPSPQCQWIILVLVIGGKDYIILLKARTILYLVYISGKNTAENWVTIWLYTTNTTIYELEPENFLDLIIRWFLRYMLPSRVFFKKKSLYQSTTFDVRRIHGPENCQICLYLLGLIYCFLGVAIIADVSWMQIHRDPPLGDFLGRWHRYEHAKRNGAI